MGAFGRTSRATWLSFWLGAWGIATGCGLFLLLWHERKHPVTFLVALGLAAVASYVVETTRALIEGHADHGPKGSRASRVVVTILTLAVVELFIVAVHTAVNLPPATLASASEALFGRLGAAHVSPGVSLATVALVWVVLGGLLAACLMRLLPTLEGGFGRRVARGAGWGALVGFVGAPLGMLAAVLLSRVVASAWLFVADHEAWVRHVGWIADQGWLASLLMHPVRILGTLWAAGWFGKVIFAVFVVGAVAVSLDPKQRAPLAVFIVLGLAALIAVPLLVDLEGLLALLVVAAVVWGVPATAIGAITPSLRAPSAHPALWGIVAFGGALALVGVTLARLGPAWLLVPAALLALSGVLFRRRDGPQVFWPLVALCGGALVAGSTWVRQEVTSHSVFERFHALADVTLPEREPAPLVRFMGRDAPPWILGRGAGLPGWLDARERAPVQDHELDLAVAALATDDAGAVAHRAWRELRRPEVAAEQQVAALRMLAERFPVPVSLPGAQNLPTRLLLQGTIRPSEQLQRSFGTRVAADLADAEAVVAFAREIDAAGTPPPLAVGIPLLERLDARASTLRHPPSVEHARALRARLGDAVAAEEHARVERWEALADDYVAADADDRLKAPPLALRQDLETALATWTGSARRTAVEGLRTRLLAAWQDARDRQRAASARLLELCFTGSLGFWVCVGLLAGGALLRREESGHAHTQGAGGRAVERPREQ